ncbi:hypothetical protein T10_9518 [Trichinella papuae]|uniref:Uncharacterized protein n=1 Tax=Trichinella papuae TaxID=268474 RepID=A0A0V1MMC5_9BILA|nr:hypothetical protein T10_9518 [Trichinella papuae]
MARASEVDVSIFENIFQKLALGCCKNFHQLDCISFVSNILCIKLVFPLGSTRRFNKQKRKDKLY